MMRTTALTLLLLTGLASAGDSEAEKFYRDAWWQESSRADFEKALEGYLRATKADGPASVRAKAQLKVADLLKRLGKTGEAMVVLDALRQKFPNEAEVLAVAAQRAKEWTAVDLRKSYSEWYHRYMFSSEFQEKVVEKVLTLAADDDEEDWLLAIGDAAVPALREAVKSRNPELVYRAIVLLLRLGEVPPARVLLESNDYDEWWWEEDAWRAIMVASEASRARLAGEIVGTTSLARMLRAAANSPAFLIKTLAGNDGARAVVDDEEMVKAILSALHATNDAQVHAGLADLAVHPKSSAAVRPLAAELLIEEGWRGASASDWLEWSRNADTFDLRRAAIVNAGRVLQPDDGETIDAILDDIEEVGKVGRALRVRLTDDFLGGLLRNGRLVQLRWSPERLQRFIRMFLIGFTRVAERFIRLLRADRLRGSNVLEALLLDPTLFAPDEGGRLPLPENVLHFDLSDPDEAFAAARWARWAKRSYLRKWKGWTDKQRFAGLRLALAGLAGEPRHQRELAAAIDTLTGGEASDGVLALLKQLRGR